MSVNVWLVENVRKDNTRVFTACRTREQARREVKRNAKNNLATRMTPHAVSLDLSNVKQVLD
jgi:lysozyme family protein